MIDPENLRRRLDDVWTALGRQADAESYEVMRACALTLIAIVDEDQDPDAMAETLAQLMHEHPSRAIVVRLAAGEGDLLDADVDARCWMPFGSRQQICSEQIVIRCSEKTLAEVPGVILPLVVADLPVVLWCASDRAHRSAAFPALAAPAGRLLLDTFRAPSPLEALESLSRQGSRNRMVMDLSWTRLTRWRALLAQVFENELYRRAIPRFTEITIGYEGAEPARIPSTALLLAGWLVSRLGWQWDGARLPPGLGFRHQPADCSQGRLRTFELASREDPASRIAIARTGENWGEVRVEMAELEPVMNRVSLARSTGLLLLSEELAIQTPDPVFDQSLECALRIARSLAASGSSVP